MLLRLRYNWFQSTIVVLLIHYRIISCMSHNVNIISVIFFDLPVAFDTVDQNLLSGEL